MFEEELTELGKVGLDLSDCILSKNDRIIGWLCSYVPEEIIHASGFYPMRIRGKGDPIGRADGLLHNNLSRPGTALPASANRKNNRYWRGGQQGHCY